MCFPTVVFNFITLTEKENEISKFKILLNQHWFLGIIVKKEYLKSRTICVFLSYFFSFSGEPWLIQGTSVLLSCGWLNKLPPNMCLKRIYYLVTLNARTLIARYLLDWFNMDACNINHHPQQFPLSPVYEYLCPFFSIFYRDSPYCNYYIGWSQLECFNSISRGHHSKKGHNPRH